MNNLNLLRTTELIADLLKQKFDIDINITCNNLQHGDICTNAPIILSKKLGISIEDAFESIKNEIYDFINYNSTSLARSIQETSQNIAILRSIQLIKGFCNIYVSDEFLTDQIYHALGANYGKSDSNNTKVNIEYVSPNPTGPLHIGHLRSIYADVLANILDFNGYNITKECYINDMGHQVDEFEKSVLSACQELKGIESNIERLYKGQYVDDLAKAMNQLHMHDDHIQNQGNSQCHQVASFRTNLLNIVVDKMKSDLNILRIKHNIYTYESHIYNDGLTQEAFDILDQNQLITYQELDDVKSKRGATSKQKAYAYTPSCNNDAHHTNLEAKVLLRNDKSPTYFANDLGYQLDKMKRCYDKIIILYGADHIGQIAWMHAAFNDIARYGNYKSEFIPIAHEVVTLKRNGEHFKMSKRSGIFVSAYDAISALEDPLILRFFMISKNLNTAYCIDIDKIKEISKENKFFYIQYAYARASSIIRNSVENDYNQKTLRIEHLTPSMITLARYIMTWPYVIHQIGESMNVPELIHYMEQLAEFFHQVWNDGNNNVDNKFCTSDHKISSSRLVLVQSFKNVMSICMQIIDINSYEHC